MASDDKKFIENFTELIARIIFGIERFKYEDVLIGSDIFIINYIFKNNKCTMKEITEFTNSIASTTTRKINRLVKNNFIRREVGENDRRKIYLLLTKKGINLYENFINNRDMGFNLMINQLTEKEFDIFDSIISKLVNRGNN